MTDPTHDHSRVSPEGRALGAQMARLADKACVALAALGEPDDRCKSCAFRAGTVPNGCLQTQMDVMKAVVENVPFHCHQHDRKGSACHGWLAAQASIMRAEELRGQPRPYATVPWDFSPPDEQEPA